MTLQAIPGTGFYAPDNIFLGNQANPPAYQSNALIDATGEKFAFIGKVWNKDHASKDIHKVGFRFGAITKAGGSALTVSLQDVSLTANPQQPDETQDQTVAIANADAGFASNVWYQTAAFSADRTVAFGELLAVVIEYDGGGRLSSDSVTLSNIAISTSYTMPSGSLKTGGTWVATGQTALPNLVLEFSDGTFGTLDGGCPSSAQGTFAFKQDTTGADEYGNEFSFPFACKVDGCWLGINTAAATSDFSIILYSGTTPLVTVAIDASTMTINNRWMFVPFTETTLTINTVYILAVQPTQTTSNVTVWYYDVSNANHFQATGLGTTCRLNNRINTGSWAGATTTRRLYMGLRISALDDGAGAAGGLLVNRGGTGGIL